MRTLRLLLLSFVASFACSHMVMPTDFSTVSAGTRANLKANFSEAENKFNPCADSVSEVRARLSGYSSSLAITSLENLRLRLDGDGTATAKFHLETSNGDSLFRVSEDSTAKFFGNVTVAGTTTHTGGTTFSALTASLPVFTDGSKALASNAMTGTGSVMMSASPTTTGTLTGSAATFSGAVSTGALSATTGAFSGILSPAAAMTFTGAGSAADWSLWRSAGAGLSIRGGAGSSYDFALFTPASTYLMRNPTGTQSLEFPGTGTNTISGSLIVNGVAGTTHQIRTAIAATGVVKVADVGTFGNTNNPRLEFHFDEGNREVIQRMTGSTSPITWRFQNSAATDLLTLTNTGAAAIPGTLGVTSVATFTAAPVFSSVTASQILSVNGSKALTSTATTGSGSVVLATSPSISGPTFTGTIATPLTASRTVITDGSGNLSVNTETGTGSHVRATSPTLTTPAIGAATGTSLNLSGNLTADSVVSSKFHSEGTFTGTLTGLTTSPTTSVKWTRIGKVVTICMDNAGGTSNATTFTVTGMTPASLIPTHDNTWAGAGLFTNSGSVVSGFIQVRSTGVISLANGGNTSGWTNSGSKYIGINGAGDTVCGQYSTQ